MIEGNGVNQSAASLVAGTWTGASPVISAQQALTTTMTRYQFTGVVPSSSTQLAVLLSFTPTGTAGADELDRHQRRSARDRSRSASPFEHLDAQVVLEVCQRYAWVIPEPAAGVVIGAGMNTGAAAQIFYMATPVQLLKAPTVTVSAGTFKTHQAGRRDSDHDHRRCDAHAERHLDQRQLGRNGRAGDAASGRRRLGLDHRQRRLLISDAVNP